MLCPVCKRSFHCASGCNPYEVRLKGKTYPSIPFKGEGDKWAGDKEVTTCPDCGAPEGKTHHGGCDWERCPVCHGQLLMCGGCGGTVVTRTADATAPGWYSLANLVPDKDLCEEAAGMFESTALVWYPIYDDGSAEWVVGEAEEIYRAIADKDAYYESIQKELIPAPTWADIQKKFPSGAYLFPVRDKGLGWVIAGVPGPNFAGMPSDSAETVGLRYLLHLRDNGQ